MRTCQIDCEAPHCSRCGCHTVGWLHDFQFCSECEIQAEFESEQRIENERTLDGLETPFAEQLDGGFCDEQFDQQGWPGDGSGTDDLADYNANEADDYANE